MVRDYTLDRDPLDNVLRVSLFPSQLNGQAMVLRLDESFDLKATGGVDPVGVVPEMDVVPENTSQAGGLPE
jgi:hypothetical protein